jgi:hypothetical protein
MEKGQQIAYIHHWVSGIASYKRSGLTDKRKVLEFCIFLVGHLVSNNKK